MVFEGVDNAEAYTVTLTGGGVTKTAEAKLNRYADFTGLTPGETYSVTISAANSAGSGPVSAAVETVTTTGGTVLPPVIWHTEPIDGAFFVGYSVKNADDTYELEYGTQSGNYTQSMTFDTEGSVKVSGLTGGQTYYHRLRSITGGVPSAWSQEVAVTVETTDQAREVPVVKGAAGGETSVSLTIQPSWKATGYVVKYGESADNLDRTVTIRRAAVEQLTVDGLDTGKAYWFSVAALNGDVISEYSAPVSAVTAEPGSQNVAVAAVETGSLTLSPFQTQGTVSITASSTFDTEKTLTVVAENLPEGITVPDSQSFAVPADGSASFALPVTLTGNVEKGWYAFTVSVLDGETVLASREVELTACEGRLLLEDDFSQAVEGRYTQSGSGVTGFDDVEAGSWYEEAVSAMVEAGLMQGTGGNLFQPFGTVTRATMWTILARMDGVDTEGGESWYEKARTWAVAEGVSDGTNPDVVVTREQIAAMLYRYAGSPAAEGQLDFADSAAVSDWAAQAVMWAVEDGILTGTPDGRLNPQGTATRAEAAVMLQRFADAK